MKKVLIVYKYIDHTNKKTYICKYCVYLPHNMKADSTVAESIDHLVSAHQNKWNDVFTPIMRCKEEKSKEVNKNGTYNQVCSKACIHYKYSKGLAPVPWVDIYDYQCEEYYGVFDYDPNTKTLKQVEHHGIPMKLGASGQKGGGYMHKYKKYKHKYNKIVDRQH